MTVHTSNPSIWRIVETNVDYIATLKKVKSKKKGGWVGAREVAR